MPAVPHLLRLLSAVAAVLGCATAHAGTPAHYLVLEVDATGHAQPLYYREVELALAPSDAEPARMAARKRAPLTPGVARIEAHDAHGLVAVQDWKLSDHLRSEAVDDHGQFVARRIVTDAPRYIVARAPLSAQRLDVQVGSVRQRIDLAEVRAQQAALPLAAIDVLPAKAKAAATGNPANRVDLLVMGDGYTASEQARFDSDAQRLQNAFNALTPYVEYTQLLNWSRLFVASPQSGADHPQNCPDSTINSDPRRGQLVDTAFDATFCAFDIHRLLTVNLGKVFAAASSTPDWDQIVLIVNDPVYGGSGGALPVGSAHAAAQQIMLHEYAHTFTGLADEYTSAYPGFPVCSDRPGVGSPCEANATDVAQADQVKWRHWFAAGNPIPTPPGRAGVGLFEGARYLTTGMYRPADQCLMSVLGAPFCPICAQEYVRTLYAGGWGVPAAGIDLIEPGTESPSPARPVDYEAGQAIEFSATVLQPSGAGARVQWRLDGTPIDGATGTRYRFAPAAGFSGIHTLELQVTDATALVHPLMSNGLTLHTRRWTLQPPGTPSLKTGVWWNPAESGWGMFTIDQGDTLVPGWFTYDNDGEPTWFLISAASPEADGSYSGLVYRQTGDPYSQSNDGVLGTSREIGSAHWRFTGDHSLQFDYTINGTTQQKSLVRFGFGNQSLVCRPSEPSRAAATNYSDLWWGGQDGSGGWGLHISHLGEQMFATWYSFDADREALFLIGALTRQADGSYAGPLLRQRDGTPFLAIANAAASPGADSVGEARLRFSDGETAVFSYRIGALDVSKNIRRFRFGSTPNVCEAVSAAR